MIKNRLAKALMVISDLGIEDMDGVLSITLYPRSSISTTVHLRSDVFNEKFIPDSVENMRNNTVRIWKEVDEIAFYAIDVHRPEAA